MLKTVLVVGAAAGIGIVVGDMIDAKLGESVGAYGKLGATSRKGAKTGIQAGSVAITYSVVSSIVGR